MRAGRHLEKPRRVGGRRLSLGEDVDVVAIFRLEDWAHWNELRREAVLDPAMAQWIEVLELMRRGGGRKFYSPTEFSPLR